MGCHLSVRSTGKLSHCRASCVRAGVDLSTKGEEREREREDLSMRVGTRGGKEEVERGGTGSHLPDLKIRSNRGFRADRDPTEISKVSSLKEANIYPPFTFERFVRGVSSSVSSRFEDKRRIESRTWHV